MMPGRRPLSAISGNCRSNHGVRRIGRILPGRFRTAGSQVILRARLQGANGLAARALLRSSAPVHLMVRLAAITWDLEINGATSRRLASAQGY
jgi:hypothetical protein